MRPSCARDTSKCTNNVTRVYFKQMTAQQSVPFHYTQVVKLSDWNTEPDWAETDLRNSRMDSPLMWPHPDSLKRVMKRRNNDVETCHDERSKSRISILVYLYPVFLWPAWQQRNGTVTAAYVYRSSTLDIQRREGCRACVLLQLGTRSNAQFGSGLARRQEHLQTSLHGRRVSGNAAGEWVHQTKDCQR